MPSGYKFPNVIKQYLTTPSQMAFSPSGDIYIAAAGDHQIKKYTVSTGVISVVAGTGTAGFSGDSGQATAAQLNNPRGVAVDPTNGNLYIADSSNNRLRRVDVSTGVITTVAGSGFAADIDGLGTNAGLNFPYNVCVKSDGSIVYITTFIGSALRKYTVSSTAVTTMTGTGGAGYTGNNGPVSSAQVSLPTGLAIDASNNIYMAENGNNIVRRIDASTNIITLVAGFGNASFSGDNGLATDANINKPGGVWVDSSNNVYIADSSNNRIRKVTASTGVITTIAGNGTAGSSGNGDYAGSAMLNSPYGVIVDASGNVYVADSSNNALRKITNGTINEVTDRLDNTAYNDIDDLFVKKDLFLNAGLWSFGVNTYGSIGNNTTSSYSSPIQVGSLTTWKQVVGNQWSAAAIKTDGTLWTWGLNGSGQLGNNTTVANYSSPIQVGNSTNWKQISSSSGSVLSVKTDGSLWGWGINGYGQLGVWSGGVAYSSPIQIGSLSDWKQVSMGGYQGAGIKTDGTLWAWGRNDKGQLGNGTIVNYSSPVQVGSLNTWKQVSVGAVYMSAIKTDGTLWTCGYNNVGQLGLGHRTSRSAPTQVGLATNWKQVFCGDTHLLAIKTDGTLWACGYNNYGQLGNGTTVYYSSPIQVGSLTDWKQITSTVGGNYGTVAAIKTDGTLWTWGYNSGGQLGNNTIINYSSPIQVGSLTNWKQVTGGGQTVLAIQSPDLP